MEIEAGRLRRSSSEATRILSPLPHLGGPSNHITNVETHESSRTTNLRNLLCLTSFNFSYGLICGTMGLCILPAEAHRLYPRTESWALGFFLGLVGVSQLACPIAGRVSDRYKGCPAAPNVVFGKRAPFLFWGSICAVLSTGGMWVASRIYWGLLYATSLFVGMVALNVIYSVQCGLVPDLGDDHAKGTSSGMVAVLTLGGSSVGFGLMSLASHFDFHLVYPLYGFLVLLSLFLICDGAFRMELAAKIERMTTRKVDHQIPGSTLTPLVISPSNVTTGTTTTIPEDSSSPMIYQTDFPNVLLMGSSSSIPLGSLLTSLSWHEVREATKWSQIIEALKLPVTPEWVDFFWVFIGRTMYYVSVSVQAFILYFLRDVIGVKDEETRLFQIGMMSLVAQTFAAIVAFPIGRYSDHPNSCGKKPLIYLACTIMGSTYCAFLLSPLFGGPKQAYAFILACSVPYGAGNGCFLAVDYALALACVPDKSQSAQALGIWGLSAFVGSAVGPLIFGATLQLTHSAEKPAGEYSYGGYAWILIGGILATVAAGAVISRIKTVK